jgi:hypothetical protein
LPLVDLALREIMLPLPFGTALIGVWLIYVLALFACFHNQCLFALPWNV